MIEEKDPWELGQWRGFTQWKCRRCPWDTLDGEEAMREHVRTAHGPPPRKAPLVQAYDARGNPIDLQER